MLQNKRESSLDWRKQGVYRYCGPLTKVQGSLPGPLGPLPELSTGVRRVAEIPQRCAESQPRGSPCFLSWIELSKVGRTQSGHGGTEYPGTQDWGSSQRFHRVWHGMGAEADILCSERSMEVVKDWGWPCYISWDPVWYGKHQIVPCTVKGQGS